MSTNINIIDETYTETTREATRDKWDGDDTYTSHDIRGFKIVDNNKYYDLQVPYEIDRNKGYYLVYVIYSTGDSFHHEEGRIDIIDMFEDANFADKVARLIEQDYRDYKEKHGETEWTIKLPGPCGEDYQIHCNWKGYFEDLTSVEIEYIHAK